MRVLRNRWIGPIAGIGAIALAVLASGVTGAHNDSAGGISRRFAAHQTEAATPIPPRTPVITIGGEIPGRPVPPGFVGLSTEFPAIQAYGERDPSLFVQLVRNFNPGQSPVVKVGGDSTDWAWWPVRGIPRPPGIRYSLGSRWL